MSNKMFKVAGIVFVLVVVFGAGMQAQEAWRTPCPKCSKCPKVAVECPVPDEGCSEELELCQRRLLILATEEALKVHDGR